jgi:nucleolar protein 4
MGDVSKATTVFVRNLPYTCTDAGLEEAFSEIGPVKESFIIADKGAGGRSKGFGFVHFALAEDAAAAVAKSKVLLIDGRAVTIDIAKQKPPTGGAKGARDGSKSAGAGGGGGGGDAQATAGGNADDSDDGNDSDSDAPKAKSVAPPPTRQQQQQQKEHVKRGPGLTPAPEVHPTLKDGEKAARTVALGGLRLAGEPDGIDPEAALDAARACGGSVEEVVSPAPADVVNAAKLRHDGGGCTSFESSLTHILKAPGSSP